MCFRSPPPRSSRCSSSAVVRGRPTRQRAVCQCCVPRRGLPASLVDIPLWLASPALFRKSTRAATGRNFQRQSASFSPRPRKTAAARQSFEGLARIRRPVGDADTLFDGDAGKKVAGCRVRGSAGPAAQRLAATGDGFLLPPVPTEAPTVAAPPQVESEPDGDQGASFFGAIGRAIGSSAFSGIVGIFKTVIGGF